jgi:hypothetical protein
MKLLLPFLFLPLMACSSQEYTPPELGTVSWQTDHDKALALSAKSGKPVFLLFQEVPG